MNYDYEKEGYYFRVDEKLNTYDSIEKARVFLEKIEEDNFYWKWSLIALHNALYGSMILALVGTNEGHTQSKVTQKA